MAHSRVTPLRGSVEGIHFQRRHGQQLPGSTQCHHAMNGRHSVARLPDHCRCFYVTYPQFGSDVQALKKIQSFTAGWNEFTKHHQTNLWHVQIKQPLIQTCFQSFFAPIDPKLAGVVPTHGNIARENSAPWALEKLWRNLDAGLGPHQEFSQLWRKKMSKVGKAGQHGSC